MTNKQHTGRQTDTKLSELNHQCLEAFAFDFDGTIVDISKPYTIAFNETLKTFGLPPTNPIEIYQKGAPNLRDQFAQALFALDIDEGLIEKCLKMHSEIYMKIHLKHLKCINNAIYTVKELGRRGFKLGLVGGRPLFQVEPELSFLRLRDWFNPILTSEMVSHPKPAPDLVQRAADIWKTPANSILVVGDSPDDIASAKNAGALSAGICNGYFPEESIIKAKPDFLLRTILDVLDIVSNYKPRSNQERKSGG
jgi:pyrophosphatase PpaX